jgi:alpha-tubulin suppressor-like RCC1 family protein
MTHLKNRRVSFVSFAEGIRFFKSACQHIKAHTIFLYRSSMNTSKIVNEIVPRDRAIACGCHHMIALDSQGSVYTWGFNGSGQLGIGDRKLIEYQSIFPVAVSSMGSISGKTIVAISCGYDHTVAVDSSGQVHAWGNNGYGQLGSRIMEYIDMPTTVSSFCSIAGKEIIAIVAGYYFTMALDSTGKVHSWGRNIYGNLGNNTGIDSKIPMEISFGSISQKTIVMIACGFGHTVALDSKGKVHTWGLNDDGELGNNTLIFSSIPIAISSFGSISGKTIRAIACGTNHTIAMDSNAQVHTWGDNKYGQLGDTTFVQKHSSIPMEISSKSDSISGKAIIAIAGGFAHSVVLDSAGHVHALGHTKYGQPCVMEKIVAISCNDYHNMAMDSTGQVHTWGMKFLKEKPIAYYETPIKLL